MNILFCHIPKCAGTNINKYLSEKYNNYKWYIHRILKYDINKYNEYYKFTVIRNPIEKLVSLYFYQISIIKDLEKKNILKSYQEGNWIIVKELYKKYNITDIYSFLNKYKEFYYTEISPNINNLKNINETKNMTYYYIVGYLPQYLFIFDDYFNLLVDDVININEINIFMKNKFGIILSNKKINIHDHSNDDYYKYLTKDNIKDINDIYKLDYKYLFNN